MPTLISHDGATRATNGLKTALSTVVQHDPPPLFHKSTTNLVHCTFRTFTFSLNTRSGMNSHTSHGNEHRTADTSSKNAVLIRLNQFKSLHTESALPSPFQHKFGRHFLTSGCTLNTVAVPLPFVYKRWVIKLGWIIGQRPKEFFGLLEDGMGWDGMG
jgi:hypothetical protein